MLAQRNVDMKYKPATLSTSAADSIKLDSFAVLLTNNGVPTGRLTVSGKSSKTLANSSDG